MSNDEKLTDKNLKMKFSSTLNAFIYFQGLDPRVKENPYRFLEMALMKDFMELGLQQRAAFVKAMEYVDMVMYWCEELEAKRFPSPNRRAYAEQAFGIPSAQPKQENK